MNRRNFFKRLGVAAVTAPAIIKALQEVKPNCDLTLKSVKPTGTKNLKAVWSAELEQDLQAYHNIDVRRILIDKMSKQLQEEIDRDILKKLV
jgi:hypothetical protein